MMILCQASGKKKCNQTVSQDYQLYTKILIDHKTVFFIS